MNTYVPVAVVPEFYSLASTVKWYERLAFKNAIGDFKRLPSFRQISPTTLRLKLVDEKRNSTHK